MRFRSHCHIQLVSEQPYNKIYFIEVRNQSI